jgi:hypothetical protein
MTAVVYFSSDEVMLESETMIWRSTWYTEGVGSCGAAMLQEGLDGFGMFRGRESIGMKLTCDCCHFELGEAWMVLVGDS